MARDHGLVASFVGMNPSLKSLLLNFLGSALWAILGGGSVWLYQWWRERNLRERRLREIFEVRREDEIAVCLRVGGASTAAPDVEAYLRVNLPKIKTLFSYDVAPTDLKEDENLAQPRTAASIIEDIIEGLRAYGKGQLTRIHFFPSGIVAYTPILPAMLSNWGTIVVYHWTGSDYVPLYEISKDKFHQTRRVFPSIKTWEVLKISEAELIEQ